jgi:hypothetical protein
VIYLRTQKPVPDDKDWDTSEDEGHKPDAVAMSRTSMRGIPHTSERHDDEGFTPVPMRHNRKYRRSQTPTTPIFETQSQVPQKQRKPAPDMSTTLCVQSPPEEIQLTQRPDEYSNMDEQPLHLPVQMDTLTEFLQERLVEMTNHIDHKELQLTEKLQATEARMQKMERKSVVERQTHRQYMDKMIKRLEDWEENLLQREQRME